MSQFIIFIFVTCVYLTTPLWGCLQLLNGWSQLSVEERSERTSIVIVVRVISKISPSQSSAESSSSSVYSAVCDIEDVLKGLHLLADLMERNKSSENTVIVNGDGSGGVLIGRPRLVIRGFGPLTLCLSDVVPGRRYIVFAKLRRQDGLLTGHYTDSFGAAEPLNTNAFNAVAQTQGWHTWSQWSGCSTTCGARGQQLRTRQCILSPCSHGVTSQLRTCANWSCQESVNLLSQYKESLSDGSVTLLPSSSTSSVAILFDLHYPPPLAVSQPEPTSLSEARTWTSVALLLLNKSQTHHVQSPLLQVLFTANELQIKVFQKQIFYKPEIMESSDPIWVPIVILLNKTSLQIFWDCREIVKETLHPSFDQLFQSPLIISNGWMNHTRHLVAITDSRWIMTNQCEETEISQNQFDTPKMEDTGNKQPPSNTQYGQDTLIDNKNTFPQQYPDSNNLLDVIPSWRKNTTRPQQERFRPIWSDWTPCSVTCGTGWRRQILECSDNSNNCLQGLPPELLVNIEKCSAKNSCSDTCRVTCHNGATCDHDKCICTHGYKGVACGEAICEKGCHNGGLCVRPGLCACPQGYISPDCLLPSCDVECQNGGQCVEPNTCACPVGFQGKTCQFAICIPPCQNNGSCIFPNLCSCPIGTSGPRCEYFECFPRCMNNGVCIGQNKCECKQGFHGKYCQNAQCWRCFNGGRCTKSGVCRCPKGYYGVQCETKGCDVHLKYYKVTKPVIRVISQPWHIVCNKDKLCHRIKHRSVVVHKIIYKPYFQCT